MNAFKLNPFQLPELEYVNVEEDVSISVSLLGDMHKVSAVVRGQHAQPIAALPPTRGVKGQFFDTNNGERSDRSHDGRVAAYPKLVREETRGKLKLESRQVTFVSGSKLLTVYFDTSNGGATSLDQVSFILRDKVRGVIDQWTIEPHAHGGFPAVNQGKKYQRTARSFVAIRT